MPKGEGEPTTCDSRKTLQKFNFPSSSGLHRGISANLLAGPFESRWKDMDPSSFPKNSVLVNGFIYNDSFDCHGAVGDEMAARSTSRSLVLRFGKTTSVAASQARGKTVRGRTGTHACQSRKSVGRVPTRQDCEQYTPAIDLVVALDQSQSHHVPDKMDPQRPEAGACGASRCRSPGPPFNLAVSASFPNLFSKWVFRTAAQRCAVLRWPGETVGNSHRGDKLVILDGV